VATYSLVFDRLLSASLDTEGSKQMIYQLRHGL
jgi:hypothetical protein